MAAGTLGPMERGRGLTPFDRAEEDRVGPEEGRKWRDKRAGWGESLGANPGEPHKVRGDYVWHPAGSFIAGDAFWDDKAQESRLVDHVEVGEDERVSMLTRRRRSAVGQEVVSRLQFGTAGITEEEEEPQAHSYWADDLLPRRG